MVDRPDAFEQADMFPDLLPWQAVEYHKAAAAHFGTGTRRAPTREQLATKLGYSANQIDRWHQKFPKLIPKPKDLQYAKPYLPPWVKKPELLNEYRVDDLADAAPIALNGSDTTGDLESYDLVRYTGDGRMESVHVIADKEGVLHLARWGHSLIALAASLAAFVMVDGMDGRYDQHIRWCAVFAKRLGEMLFK